MSPDSTSTEQKLARLIARPAESQVNAWLHSNHSSTFALHCSRVLLLLLTRQATLTSIAIHPVLCTTTDDATHSLERRTAMSHQSEPQPDWDAEQCFDTPQFTSLRITTTPPCSPTLKPQPAPADTSLLPDCNSKNASLLYQLNSNASPSSQATTLGDAASSYCANLSPLTRISSFNSSPVSQQSAQSSCVLHASSPMSAHDLLTSPPSSSNHIDLNAAATTKTRRKTVKSSKITQSKRSPSSSVSPRVTSVPLLYTEPQWMEQLKHDGGDGGENLKSDEDESIGHDHEANKENRTVANRSLMQQFADRIESEVERFNLNSEVDKSKTQNVLEKVAPSEQVTLTVQHMHSATSRPAIEWRVNAKDQRFGLRPKYLGGLVDASPDASSGCLSAATHFVYLNARSSEFYRQRLSDPVMTIWLLTKNTSFTLSTANSVSVELEQM